MSNTDQHNYILFQNGGHTVLIWLTNWFTTVLSFVVCIRVLGPRFITTLRWYNPGEHFKPKARSVFFYGLDNKCSLQSEVTNRFMQKHLKPIPAPSNVTHVTHVVQFRYQSVKRLCRTMIFEYGPLWDWGSVTWVCYGIPLVNFQSNPPPHPVVWFYTCKRNLCWTQRC